MPRRCRVCHRPLKQPQWRKVGLGPVCARRLGLRMVRTVAVVPAAPMRRHDPDDDQLALFDLSERSDG